MSYVGNKYPEKALSPLSRNTSMRVKSIRSSEKRLCLWNCFFKSCQQSRNCKKHKATDDRFKRFCIHQNTFSSYEQLTDHTIYSWEIHKFAK